MRHQVRLMMGSLLRVGMGQMSLEQLKDSLHEGSDMVALIAPASGLMLTKINLS